MGIILIFKQKMSESFNNIPVLCLICTEFYGDPTKDNLCSKCFNGKKKTESEMIAAATKSTAQISNETITKTTINTPVNENITLNKPKQENTSRCFKCNKKIGLSSVQCKCE